MEWVEWVYAVCFFVGLIYALFVGLLSGVFGFEHAGGHDLGGGHDVGAGHDAGSAGGDGHTVHFSPMSPVVISMFLTSFGGAGIISIKMFGLTNMLYHLPIAIASGFVIAGATFGFFYKAMALAQGTSLHKTDDLVGSEAQVIITIPGNEQLGEITYTVKGSRFNASARSEDKLVIPANTPVVITKVVGNVFFVKGKYK